MRSQSYAYLLGVVAIPAGVAVRAFSSSCVIDISGERSRSHEHSADAAADPMLAGQQLGSGRRASQANIITSMGLAAHPDGGPHRRTRGAPHPGRRAGAALDRPADLIDGDEGTVVHGDWHPSPGV
jgi:hypothetical protein